MHLGPGRRCDFEAIVEGDSRKSRIPLLSEPLDDLSPQGPGERSLHGADVGRGRRRSILTRQHVQKMLQPPGLLFELSDLLLRLAPFAAQRKHHPLLCGPRRRHGPLPILDEAAHARETVLPVRELGIARDELLALSLKADHRSGVVRDEEADHRHRFERVVPLIDRQQQAIDVHIDDVTLFADRGKIRLVLENLLSNAIKYAPRGGTISIRARALDADLVLEVADTGAGVPMADRAHIFEAFHTGRSPGGHVRGTGIGLSVVNEFVQIHRGTIEIVDGEFRGAHFRIRMPQRANQMQVAPATVTVTAIADPRSVARRKVHAA